MNHILGWFTDVKNRPEIKAVIGVFSFVAAFALLIVWLIFMRDRPNVITEALLIFGTLSVYGGGMLGVVAIADAKNDAIDSNASQLKAAQ